MELFYTLLIAFAAGVVGYVAARRFGSPHSAQDLTELTRLETEKAGLLSQLEKSETELKDIRAENENLREQNATINTRLEETRSRLEEEKKRLEEMRVSLQDSFKSLSQDVLRESQKEFLQMADEKFSDQSKRNSDTLSEKEKLIQKSLENMDGRLKDIVQRSTELKTEIETSKDETQRLLTTT